MSSAVWADKRAIKAQRKFLTREPYRSQTNEQKYYSRQAFRFTAVQFVFSILIIAHRYIPHRIISIDHTVIKSNGVATEFIPCDLARYSEKFILSLGAIALARSEPLVADFVLSSVSAQIENRDATLRKIGTLVYPSKARSVWRIAPPYGAAFSSLECFKLSYIQLRVRTAPSYARRCFGTIVRSLLLLGDALGEFRKVTSLEFPLTSILFNCSC